VAQPGTATNDDGGLGADDALELPSTTQISIVDLWATRSL